MPTAKSSKELIRAQQLIEDPKIDPRHEIVAAELVKGSTQEAALLKAGYSEKTARHAAKGVAQGKGVRAALLRIAASLSNRDLSQMAKGKLVQILEDPAIEPRIIIQAIRLGGEWGGELGPAKELVMRHEIHVPPAAQEMIARRIMELQEQANANSRSTLQMENGTFREEDSPGFQGQ